MFKLGIFLNHLYVINVCELHFTPQGTRHKVSNYFRNKVQLNFMASRRENYSNITERNAMRASVIIIHRGEEKYFIIVESCIVIRTLKLQ